MRITLIALTIAATGLLPATARAAESYDSCTGFIDSVPATIGSAGTWCLRQDLCLTAAVSGNAIEITANNVVLDCNHFKLGGLAAGPTSVAQGVYGGDRQFVTIRNCAIRGFHSGINLAGEGRGNRVLDNRLDGNLRYGIRVGGEANKVLRNRIHDTGGDVDGIATAAIAASAQISDNIIESVVSAHPDGSVYGIIVSGTGSVVRGNIIGGLVPQGGGSDRGISVSAHDVSLLDNQLTASEASVGSGIRTSQVQGTLCGGNTLGGFPTAIDGDCAELSANPSN